LKLYKENNKVKEERDGNKLTEECRERTEK
jgi:hypothetical protein